MEKTISIRLPEEYLKMLETTQMKMQKTSISKITMSDVVKNAIFWQYKNFNKLPERKF